MNQLLVWAIGSTLALLFVLVTVFVAMSGNRWAKQDGDPRVIRTARHALLGCIGGLISALAMTTVSVLSYIQWHTDWIVWLLLSLPWIAALWNAREVWHIWTLRTERQEAKEEMIRVEAKEEGHAEGLIEGNAEGRVEQKTEADAEGPIKVVIVAQEQPVEVKVVTPLEEVTMGTPEKPMQVEVVQPEGGPVPVEIVEETRKEEKP